MLRPIEELKVRITSTTQVPDPTKINSTGDWYYLDHISSSLAHYDSTTKKFIPLLAESWTTQPDGTHLFKIRQGIKFNDGTPISTKDILWTIKRQLKLKTSTHFPLWEYIVGCDALQNLEDECDGLKITSEHEIAIHLKIQTDSFFLQMASPETGIWAASDMNPVTAELNPTKFSGPYALRSRDDSSALLMRNEHSLLSQQFPNSPRMIRIKRIPLPQLDQALLNNEVDLAIRSHNPLAEIEWKDKGMGVMSTTPSTMIYLFGLGTGQRASIGRDFIEQVWKINRDPQIISSETFLPFAKNYGLTRVDFLSHLANRTAPALRILCPEGFFSKAFLSQLSEAGTAVNTRIEFFFLGQTEWFAAFNNPKAAEKYDYILSSYAASERYPAVQLRYLTKNILIPPIDLKSTESPDINTDRAAILRNYQRWLLKTHQAIPLFFNKTLFIHNSRIDLGAQPSSDAEIELWRVQERVGQ